jgi:hypothetical protein
MRNRKLGLGLLATAAMMVMAFAATSASATVVSPAGKAITATQVATGQENPNHFTVNNAYGGTLTNCAKASFKAQVPVNGEHDLNENQPQVGTHSQTAGSVYMDLDEVKFEECAVYAWSGEHTKGEPQAPSVVTTTEGWAIGLHRITNGPAIAAISVPAQGATINIAGGLCVLEVAPAGETAPATGLWTNGAPSQLRVDAQIPLAQKSGNCAAIGINLGQPAQFEATFNVTVDNQAENVTVN